MVLPDKSINKYMRLFETANISLFVIYMLFIVVNSKKKNFAKKLYIIFQKIQKSLFRSKLSSYELVYFTINTIIYRKVLPIRPGLTFWTFFKIWFKDQTGRQIFLFFRDQVIEI